MKNRIAILGIFLLFLYFNFQLFTNPTPAMEGSILVGDKFIISKIHYGYRAPLNLFRFPGFTKPHTGDAVVFNVPNYLPDANAPIDLRTYYIKRCIGTPGDKLEIKDQQVYLNDKPMENPIKLRQEYFIRTSESLDDAFFRKYDIVNTLTEASQNVNWQPVEEADSTGTTTKLIGYKVNTNY